MLFIVVKDNVNDFDGKFRHAFLRGTILRCLDKSIAKGYYIFKDFDNEFLLQDLNMDMVRKIDYSSVLIQRLYES